MISLYKLIDGFLHYWQYWENEDSVTVHHGLVGDTGESLELDGGLFSDYNKMAMEIMEDKLEEGYQAIDFVSLLVVRFTVDPEMDPVEEGMSSPMEIEIDEALKWRGLGTTHRTVVAGNVVEVTCYVNDIAMATEWVEREMEKGEFAGYLGVEVRGLPDEEPDLPDQ